MPGPDPIPGSALSYLMAPTTSWISRRRSPVATIAPSSVVRSSRLRGGTLPLSSMPRSLSRPCSWAIASTRPSISPTAGCGYSKSTPKKCRRIDPAYRGDSLPAVPHCSMPQQPAIWTVGHSTRPIGEFIDLLRAHGIALLVDVRTIPRSRYNPQFNTDMLTQPLGEAGLQYRHLPT